MAEKSWLNIIVRESTSVEIDELPASRDGPSNDQINLHKFIRTIRLNSSSCDEHFLHPQDRPRSCTIDVNQLSNGGDNLTELPSELVRSHIPSRIGQRAISESNSTNAPTLCS
ncbi:hypothetical protein PspLS_09274 [Pyricularia sp. CBS 133598]|nr:hypothetical protein PspLS_09274 [Pyricularia sp. CBS 133598]